MFIAGENFSLPPDESTTRRLFQISLPSGVGMPNLVFQNITVEESTGKIS